MWENVELVHLYYLVGLGVCWLLYRCMNSEKFKYVCVPVS